MGRIVPLVGTAGHPSRLGSRPACGTGGLWPRVFATRAAVVERPTVGPGAHQSAVGADGPPRPAARHPRHRSAGHHPLGRVGSLAGRHRGGWAYFTHRLGGHPLPMAEGALPGHDPGAPPAAPRRLPGWRCAGRWWPTAASPAPRSLPCCARGARTSACACG